MKKNLCSTCPKAWFPVRYAAVVLFSVLIVWGVMASRATADARPAGASESPELARILDRLQDHYQHTESFSAKFHEELSGVGRVKRTRSGQVYYQRPGKMRWDFAAPHNETVVSDGHKLYDYQPDLNQVLEVPIDRAFKSAAPLAFLLGIGKIRDDFKASLPLSTPSDSLVHVILIPKRGGDRIEMGLDPSTYDLVAVTVTNALGNTTAIQFSDIHTNVKLADLLFAFEVPPGADVVEAPAPGPSRM
jgi:outer membrane lipoprotein carrier protein